MKDLAVFTDTHSSRNSEITPYRRMWARAIIQAIRDATMPDSGPYDFEVATKSGIKCYQNRMSETRAAKASARAWFGTSDFFISCACAGIDGEALLEAYRSGRVDWRSFGDWRDV